MSSFIYMHDGTLEGLMTCIFEAFAKNETPEDIVAQASLQLEIGQNIRYIATSHSKANRVLSGIGRTIGETAYEQVFVASLSSDPSTGRAILDFLKVGFAHGRGSVKMLSDPAVWRLFEIYRIVSKEYGRYVEFLRFSELEGGVFFGEFAPESRVLPLMMPHFADRFNDMPFMICDKTHNVVGISAQGEWMLADSQTMQIPSVSKNESNYRQLWKLFFNTVAIKERINPKNQRNFLPVKYRSHMTEFIH